MKVCRVCGDEKPLDEFPRDRTSKDGRGRRCTMCNRAAASEWQKKNRKRATERQTAWKAAHKERVNAQAQARYHADLEASRAKARAQNNTPAGRERRRRWDKANAQKKADYNRRRWASLDPEENRKRQREWKAANRDKVAADNHRRRASRYDAASITYIGVLQRDPCAYCGSRECIQIDHITPLAGGGENHWSNITAACSSCNRGKSTKTLLVAMLT